MEPSSATTLPMLLRLQIRRAHPLLTIGEVAERTGINRRTLYNWTQGSRVPTPTNLTSFLRKINADDATIMAALLLLSAPGGQ